MEDSILCLDLKICQLFVEEKFNVSVPVIKVTGKKFLYKESQLSTQIVQENYFTKFKVFHQKVLMPNVEKFYGIFKWQLGEIF